MSAAIQHVVHAQAHDKAVAQVPREQAPRPRDPYPQGRLRRHSEVATDDVERPAGNLVWTLGLGVKVAALAKISICPRCAPL